MDVEMIFVHLHYILLMFLILTDQIVLSLNDLILMIYDKVI